MMNILEKMQERIANLSVGASTVRGQPKDTAKEIREFLKKVDLSQFKNIEEDQFINLLDKLTHQLMQSMPTGNFGFARKCLNIFLLEVTHNTLLTQEYAINKLIPFLEVPIDNPNQKKLKDEAGKKMSWKWKSIKDLTPEDNKKIQNFAQEYMKKAHNMDRVYFDLINWRVNSKNDKIIVGLQNGDR